MVTRPVSYKEMQMSTGLEMAAHMDEGTSTVVGMENRMEWARKIKVAQINVQGSRYMYGQIGSYGQGAKNRCDVVPGTLFQKRQNSV